MKKKYDWECAHNHLPEWSDKYDIELLSCMSDNDSDLVDGLLNQYNELIDKEEKEGADGHAIFGVENEKEEIINEVVKIYSKYRDQAVELSKWLDSMSKRKPEPPANNSNL